jgi:hypothetical protein
MITSLKAVAFTGDENSISLSKKICDGVREWALYEAGKAGTLPPVSYEIPEWVQNLVKALKKTALRPVFVVNSLIEASAYRDGFGLGAPRLSLLNLGVTDR